MRMLFICAGNSCRSQMAEAFANMLGHEGVEAFSAGSQPDSKVEPLATEVMRELGYDLSAHRPKFVEDLPDLEFDYAVIIGGDEMPLVKARMTLEWDIPDPAGMPLSGYRAVRDQIRERVTRLLSAPRVPSR